MQKEYNCELVVTHPVSKRSLCGGSGARFCPPFIGQDYKESKQSDVLSERESGNEKQNL